MILFGLWLCTQDLYAQPLSEVALFRRCYGHLTGTYARSQNPDLIKVKQGEETALQACSRLIDNALLTTAEQVNPSDEFAVRMLNTFHKLHASWFRGKTLNSRLAPFADETSVALYFTRALIKAQVPLEDAFTSTTDWQPRREIQNPTTSLGFTLAALPLSPEASLADTGDLLGFVAFGSTPWVFTAQDATQTTFLPRTHAGGGFLGSSLYHQMQHEGSRDWDGAVMMPRQFGKSFFKDVLCRELPVVRKADGLSFIDSTADAPFRHAGDCVRCHVSMDRLSGLLRNHQTTPLSQDPKFHYPDPYPITAPSNQYLWPVEADGSYKNRPPEGTLYYRGYDGSLVDVQVDSFAQLGQVLANQEEPYLCFAKRYYHYLTGISVDLGDLEDPSHGGLAPIEISHRNQVIALGLELKNHQNPATLIKEMMALPAYRQSDFR